MLGTLPCLASVLPTRAVPLLVVHMLPMRWGNFSILVTLAGSRLVEVLTPSSFWLLFHFEEGGSWNNAGPFSWRHGSIVWTWKQKLTDAYVLGWVVVLQGEGSAWVTLCSIYVPGASARVSGSASDPEAEAEDSWLQSLNQFQPGWLIRLHWIRNFPYTLRTRYLNYSYVILTFLIDTKDTINFQFLPGFVRYSVKICRYKKPVQHRLLQNPSWHMELQRGACSLTSTERFRERKFSFREIVNINSSVFWDMYGRNLLKRKSRFRDSSRLHLQSRILSEARNQDEADSKQKMELLKWSQWEPKTIQVINTFRVA
jgi:hypothetical protein